MPEYNGKCAIWPEFDAYVSGWQYIGKADVSVRLYESPRAGGRYHIDSTAMDTLLRLRTSEFRKKVSWWLASQRRQQVEIPRVTRDVLSYLQTQPMLHPGERAEWLLRYLVDQTSDIGQTFSLSISDLTIKSVRIQGNSFYYGAFSTTQSETLSEICELAQHLIEKQALRNVGTQGFMEVSVTVVGFEEVRQQTHAPAYDQAFVAMWLDDSVRELYDKGIKPAIESAGYKPYLVDDDLSVDKIDDAIIANIRQSKFMVADLTHGDDGHRGSVYYEAGFAEGLGLQVIRTCRKDLIKNNRLAFDTRQHNHIGWDKDDKNYDEFIRELTNRIIARVGPGPIQGNA